MPIELRELQKSRFRQIGQASDWELRYYLEGTSDEAEAEDYVLTNTPTTFSGLPRQRTTLEPLGPDTWMVSVRYEPKTPENRPPPPAPEAGESTYEFEIGTETVNYRQAFEEVAQYSEDSPASDIGFGGAINVTEDGVDGTDVQVPVHRFAETHYVPAEEVDAAFKSDIYQATGKVNSATFRGFAAGEVLCLGAVGKLDRATNLWEIVYRFAVSPNATGLSVGPITGIDKKGWEYLWVYYTKKVHPATKRLISVPRQANVVRVYDEADLNDLVPTP